MDIDISFAEAMLRRGAGLLEDGADAAGSDPFAMLARMLAAAAATDAPLVVLSEGGSHPALFDEAARRAGQPLTARLAALAATRQGERATMYEFDGSGPLTGNRIVAALLRPEDRPDLLHVYIAVGRLRGGEAQITVAPALLRFDAAALGQTLGLLGDAVSRSANAATAALAHAAAVMPMAGHEESGMPAALLDLYWHALTLASVRGEGGAPEGLAAMAPKGTA
ncbi:hypothetical protein [Azospirillum picis]|uniref:Uncharacterized protein n=1 Tax=Azospirillum picis TaxID=488438 RepID=A0ABU0MHT6_9PROT|nr:hypothetical protein [Azospirillum picis]MBP2299350.1 hypothetical protein [Azospirillum picis]MDQ0533012.1 hypothetical protein [Azospirillum picis]